MIALVFAAFVVLSAFNAGTMTTLQIQHYGIYTHVGAGHFAAYIRANNRAALVPAVLPALALLLISLLLVLNRPPFMSQSTARIVLGLNLIALASTFLWQRRLQAEMAESGYDAAKVRLLISTNWIRTFAYVLQALLAMAVVVHALPGQRAAP